MVIFHTLHGYLVIFVVILSDPVYHLLHVVEFLFLQSMSINTAHYIIRLPAAHFHDVLVRDAFIMRDGGKTMPELMEKNAACLIYLPSGGDIEKDQ